MDLSNCSLEQLVTLLIHASRANPTSAFAHRLVSPTGTRYFPPPSSLELLIDLHTRQLDYPQLLINRITHMQTDHFPSSPARPPRHNLTFINTNTQAYASHGFCTPTATSTFLHLVLRYIKPDYTDDDITWHGSKRLSLPAYGLTIQATDLEEIYDVPASSHIELPHPYPSYAARIAGQNPDAFLMPRKAKELPKPAKSTPAPKTRTPKSSPEGTTIAELASRLNLTPSKARQILRKHSIAKPYVFTEDELPNIERLLCG